MSICVYLWFHWLALLGATPPAPAQTTPQISYRLSIGDTTARRLRVRITVENSPKDKIAFAIPAWTPGYYQILHYEKNIEDVRAQDGAGKPLEVKHPSPRVWEAATESASNGRVTLTYEVHADDEGYGVFGSALRPGEPYAYVNGASALMYVVGHTDLPATLTVALPSDWKLASPLASPPSPAEAKEKTPTTENETTLRAESYDELIDSPLQCGQFEEVAFEVERIPFRCVLVGDHKADKPRLAKALFRIAKATIQMFGFAPFRNYLFIFHCGGDGFYGGLEHRNSTVIHLMEPLRDASDDSLLAIAAHELFHAWNIKRLRPAGLGPFDYTQEVRTASLWWAEGITDYYACLLLVRAGLRTREWFFQEFAERITDLEGMPSRTRVSLEEASRKTWEGESQGYDGLNYYIKGSLVGLYFDLRLRALTDGKKGLDDVLRDMVSRYDSQSPGYPEGAVLEALERAAGFPLRADYDRFARGTEEITWWKVLPFVGVERRAGSMLLLPDADVSPLARRVRQGLFSPDAPPPPRRLTHRPMPPFARIPAGATP